MSALMSAGYGAVRCAITIAVLVATACLSGAASAAAGTYPVAACNDAAGSGAASWTYVRTAPADQYEAMSVCPSGSPDPYGPMRNGVGVADVVDAWNEGAPDGSYAEWRFVAPPGTAVTSASITRDIGNRDEWTPYGRIDGVDQIGESCMRGMNQSFCRIQGTRIFSGLNSTSIAYGVRCVVAPYCAHGATLRSVWVLILGATVTLDDRQAPTVSNVEAAGLADGGWWNRVGVVSFSASDNTGVRRRRLVVDGVQRVVVDAPGASAGGCGEVGLGVAYSYSRPCADGRGLDGVRSVSVDPCGWGDGVHSVRGAAVDTGGLEASSPSAAAVRVDCTAPIVSVRHARDALVAGDAVEPIVDSSDGASGVDSTVVEVSVDGGGWEPYVGPVVAVAGRSYAFRARGADRAGNVSGWVGTAPVIASAPAPEPDPTGEVEGETAEETLPVVPAVADERVGVIGGGEPSMPPLTDPWPTVPTTPANKLDPRLRITRAIVRRGGTLEVAGTVARGVTGSVRVVVRTGRRRVTRSRSAPIRNGRWRATFRLRRTARRTRITVTTAPTAAFAGAAATASTAAALAQHPA